MSYQKNDHSEILVVNDNEGNKFDLGKSNVGSATNLRSRIFVVSVSSLVLFVFIAIIGNMMGNVGVGVGVGVGDGGNIGQLQDELFTASDFEPDISSADNPAEVSVASLVNVDNLNADVVSFWGNVEETFCMPGCFCNGDGPYKGRCCGNSGFCGGCGYEWSNNGEERWVLGCYDSS